MPEKRVERSRQTLIMHAIDPRDARPIEGTRNDLLTYTMVVECAMSQLGCTPSTANVPSSASGRVQIKGVDLIVEHGCVGDTLPCNL